jgi:hypothetical protein
MIVLWQDMKHMTFSYRWQVNTGDYMDRFDCIWSTAHLTASPSEIPKIGFNV